MITRAEGYDENVVQNTAIVSKASYARTARKSERMEERPSLVNESLEFLSDGGRRREGSLSCMK